MTLSLTTLLPPSPRTLFCSLHSETLSTTAALFMSPPPVPLFTHISQALVSTVMQKPQSPRLPATPSCLIHCSLLICISNSLTTHFLAPSPANLPPVYSCYCLSGDIFKKPTKSCQHYSKLRMKSKWLRWPHFICLSLSPSLLCLMFFNPLALLSPYGFHVFCT